MVASGKLQAGANAVWGSREVLTRLGIDRRADLASCEAFRSYECGMGRVEAAPISRPGSYIMSLFYSKRRHGERCAVYGSRRLLRGNVKGPTSFGASSTERVFGGH